MRGLTNSEIDKGYQISQLKRENQELLVRTLVIHVGKAYKMTGQEDDSMVEHTIDYLLQDSYRKLDSIIMAIDNGLRGIYGKLYGKLTWPQLQEWLRKFDEQAAYEREMQNSNPQRTRPKGEIELEPRTFDVKEFTKEQIKRINEIDSRK